MKDKTFKGNCENFVEKILDFLRYLEYVYIIFLDVPQSKLLWYEFLRRFECRIIELDSKITKYELEISKFQENAKKNDFKKQLDDGKIDFCCDEYWRDIENADSSRKMEVFILRLFGDEYVDFLMEDFIKLYNRKVELGIKLLSFESDRLTDMVDYLNLHKSSSNDDSNNDKHTKHL